ncbi:MAG: hypothetical protein ACD_19C00229G0001, partial [uncultured bacterium]
MIRCLNDIIKSSFQITRLKNAIHRAFGR